MNANIDMVMVPKVVNFPLVGNQDGNQTSIEYIIHTADIHIGSSNVSLSYDRREEYKRVMGELRRLIDTPGLRSKTMIVIAGDIFHHKNRVSASCIELFNYLMELIADTPVLIIPGNHDVVMNNHDVGCLIAPLLNRVNGDGKALYSNVYYSKNTELLLINNTHVMLHISVYDTRGREEIEKLTAQVYAAHPKYTLLYHGVVDGVKFGAHIENDTRMSRKALGSCHRAILGDIHEHMSIPSVPKAVYCGSMIQQNRGESRHKGVVVWNLERNEWIFKRLMNPAGFLTIDIRPLGDPISDGYKARLVAMLETLKNARDPDFAQTYAITVITDTYTKDGLWLPEITEIVGNVDNIKRIDTIIGGKPNGDDMKTLAVNTPPNNTVNTTTTTTTANMVVAPMDVVVANNTITAPEQYATNMDKNTHRAILEELLLCGYDGNNTGKGKLTREMFEYIWDIHASCEIAHKHTTWSIYKLRFSGLFRYGDGNVIDFKNLRGVCGVIANNRMGKSSILDIIVLALFNTTLRANRVDAINSHSTNAFITIKFVVNGVMWKLKKEFDRNRQQVKLWERRMEPVVVAGVETHQIPKWVDATGVDAVATYDKVRNLIGGLREFLATSMQVQESYDDDLIRMKNTDRKKVLSRLLGLDQLKDIADKAKAKLNELNKELVVINAEMPPEVNENQIKVLNDEIGELMIKINSCEARLNNAMRENKEVSVLMASFKQVGELKTKITNLTDNLATLNTELSNLENNRITLTANCAKYAVELTFSDKYKVDLCGNTPRNIITQIDAAVGKFNQLLSQTKWTSPTELANRCLLVVKSQALPNVLPVRDCTVVEAELNALIAQRSLNNATNVELTDTIANCNLKIGKLNARIKAEVVKKKPLIDTGVINDRINAIHSVYVFNPDCADCVNNREEYHKRVNIAQIQTELEIANKNNLVINSHNANIDNICQGLNADINKLEQELKEANEQLGIRARISERREELVYAREFGGLTPAQAVAVFKAKSVLEDITTGYNKLNYYITSKIDALKLEVVQCGNYIRMYKEDLANLSGVYNDSSDHIDDVIKHASELDKRCVLMQRELVDMMCELETKKKLVEVCGTNITKRAELTAKLNPINERITAINEYIKSLDVKSGLPCRLMQESIKALTIKVNELLREISDFSVKARVEDDKIDFYIRERYTDTSKHENVKKHGLSVELASGYQKFVIMLAYRLSLAATLPSSADFVFIDEGFGCLDTANAARIGELLHAVSGNYRFMFIISHIDVLQMALGTSITINNDVVTGRSKITYGQIEETVEEDYVIGEQINQQVDIPINVPVNQPVNAPVNVQVNVPVNQPVNNDVIDANGNIRCECGRMVKRGNIQRHRQTPTHIAQLAVKQQAQQQNAKK
ncbi:exonuclease SbcC [Faustovirus]|nr:putative hydrolase [Faustovirus]AMN82953.1 exonuclease SbcC [Faustovirus]AMN83940.1 exonuclease SbcC [Faustovirus]AMN84925.1 exonuclease SbcC [Faustovirus]